MRTPSRTSKLYIAGLLTALLAVLVFAQAAFNLNPLITPSEPGQIILLYLLSTFIFLVLIVFGFVLLRTIVKLGIERRADIPGARIKTKLVAALIALTLVPATSLFLFAFGLVNRSLDKWFSVPVDEIFRVTQEIDLEVQAEQRSLVQRLIGSISPEREQPLEELKKNLGFAAIALLDRDSKPIAKIDSEAVSVEALLPRLQTPGSTGAITAEFQAPFWVGSRDVNWPNGGRRIVAALPIPPRIQELTTIVAGQRENYAQLIQNRIYYRDTYVYILVIITILVLFAAVWTGLFFSRRLTVPIAALSEATQEISKGNLRHRVGITAEDELGMLIAHFNGMANRLELTTDELEARRRYMEVILESIPTGVISIDAQGRVNKMNGAARTMLSREQATQLEDLFSGKDLHLVRDLIEDARKTNKRTVAREVEFEMPGRPAFSAVSVSALPGGGHVLVVEDLTEVVRAQKETAWREVARRLAHEIKNPLTPIQLSAERIARNVSRLPSAAPRVTQVIHECVEGIVDEVSSLKNLVDEFVRFSRLPGVSRGPESVKTLVDRTMALYEGRLSGIDVRVDIPQDLPPALMDAHQIRRVLVNLIDNAVEAMADADYKVLSMRAEVVRDGKMIRLSLTDSGHGIRDEDRDRLFMPYFSTKKNGTGLGLAISGRIVAEHAGYLTAEAVPPQGTRFTLELPVCLES